MMTSSRFPAVLPLALLALPIPLAGQAQSVVPADNTFTPGGWREGIFGESEPRIQQIIDGAEFCNVSAQITGLALRRGPGKYGSVPQAGRTINTFQVRTGYAAVRPENMTLNYASNVVGSSMTTVLSGKFDLPNLMPSQGPSTWQLQWPLSQPFTYVRAVGGLVLDIEHSDSIFPSRYELDAVDVTSGFARMLPYAGCARMPNTNTCLPTLLNRNRSYPKIGDQFTTEVFNMPSAAPAFTILGLSSTQWGSVGLPFDLSTLGAAKGNFLQVSMDFVLPMQGFVAGGADPWPGRQAARLSLPIPNQPQLVGEEFFAQCFAGIGAPTLPVSAGLGWQVRVGEDRAPMQMIWGLRGGPAAMGYFGGGRGGSGPIQLHGGLVTRLTGTFQ